MRFKIKIAKYVFQLCLAMFFHSICFAQINIIATDSLTKKQKRVILRKKTAPEVRDSLLYTKIKKRLSKNKFTRKLYSVLFKDIYNSNTKSQISTIDENPFAMYEGKIVRSIAIKRLNVFGTSVYDTSRSAKTAIEKFANTLHISTRENVIRNSFLFFETGDLVNPILFRDNERLLRQQSFLHDARIYVEADTIKSHLVDVLIVTQDTWSLVPIVEFNNSKDFGLTLDHNNFSGKAHKLQLGFDYNAKAREQKTEVFGQYVIPYFKKTLITAQADLAYLQDKKIASLKVFRPFLTPEIKYAGATELSHNRFTLFDKPRGLDSVYYFPVTFNLTDAWLGRSFKLFFGDEQLKKNSRIILSLRARKITYTNRPQLSISENQTYQNRRTYLVGVGFSNRSYKRDVLIYSFGRTEDVPIGYLAGVVGGIENAELGRRQYLGLKFANGRYLPNNTGYLYGLINAGSFLKKNKPEQGVFSAESNYYSPLMNWNVAKIRQFITVNYTEGLKRFKTVEERLDIGNEGIRGVRSDSLKGIRKLVFNFETVIFTRASIAGFRIAPYVFGDLGMINFGEKSFFKGPLYSGFGLGFRFRNENLTFKTFQIRFGVYPNIPNINVFRLAFGGEQVLKLKDFDISAPEEIRFR